MKNAGANPGLEIKRLRAKISTLEKELEKANALIYRLKVALNSDDPDSDFYLEPEE